MTSPRSTSCSSTSVQILGGGVEGGGEGLQARNSAIPELRKASSGKSVEVFEELLATKRESAPGPDGAALQCVPLCWWDRHSPSLRRLSVPVTLRSPSKSELLTPYDRSRCAVAIVNYHQCHVRWSQEVLPGMRPPVGRLRLEENHDRERLRD